MTRKDVSGSSDRPDHRVRSGDARSALSLPADTTRQARLDHIAGMLTRIENATSDSSSHPHIHRVLDILSRQSRAMLDTVVQAFESIDSTNRLDQQVYQRIIDGIQVSVIRQGRETINPDTLRLLQTQPIIKAIRDDLIQWIPHATQAELNRVHNRLEDVRDKDHHLLQLLRDGLACTRNDFDGYQSLLLVLDTNRRGRTGTQEERDQRFQETMNSWLYFHGLYSGRATGDFAFRFHRAVSTDMIQVDVELQLAHDLLDGRTPFGNVQRIHGIADHAHVTPEYGVYDTQGLVGFVECKSIGAIHGRFTNDLLREHIREASSQIIKYALREGYHQAQSFIRIDAQHAHFSDMTHTDILSRVASLLDQEIILRQQRYSRATFIRWVEVHLPDVMGSPSTLLYDWDSPPSSP